jgi:hypothetical protein
MSGMTCLCRTATTFKPSGELDEDALRRYLQRLVDSKIGIYLASAGSGESHAMSRDEIKRVYEIGLEVGKGKVQVNANPPEQHTAKATREQTLLVSKQRSTSSMSTARPPGTVSDRTRMSISPFMTTSSGASTIRSRSPRTPLSATRRRQRRSRSYATNIVKSLR